MEKKLKTILEFREMGMKVYEYLHFKGYDAPIDAMEQINIFLQECLLESLENYTLIEAIEDCIVAPGETKELKTDIEKLDSMIKSIEDNKLLEFTNEGIISTYGFLTFDFQRDYENGNKILVTNNVPKEVEENYDLCVYSYCNPKITKYFGPGIFNIEKGTVIGIAGIDSKDASLDYKHSKDTEERDIQLVKKLCSTEVFCCRKDF